MNIRTGPVSIAARLLVVSGLALVVVGCSSTGNPASSSASGPTFASLSAPAPVAPTAAGSTSKTSMSTSSSASTSGPAAQVLPSSAPAVGGRTGFAAATTGAAAPDPAPVTRAQLSTSGPTISAGNIHQTVPTVPIRTVAPTGLGQPAEYGNGVSVVVTRTAALAATAVLPGEIGGPAIAVTVQVDNRSLSSIGLDSVIVSFYDSSGAPASRLSHAPSSPLAGVLAPGAGKAGTYVFAVPEAERADVRITVAYSAAAPTVAFTGSVPHA